MSDAIQAFYQIRDSVLLPGNWLQYQDHQIYLRDKNEARRSLSIGGRLQHTLGYGPFGLHTLNGAVERVAAQAINQLEKSVWEHLDSLQGNFIEGLFPETMEEDFKLPVLFQVLNQIEKIEQIKREILQAIAAKFFTHQSLLGKCCLVATTMLRRLGSIFHREKTKKGYRFFQFQATLQNVAQYCRRQLAKPVGDSLIKIQNGHFETLSSEQVEAVILAMENIEQINRLEHEMLETIRSYFFNRAARVHRWFLKAVSFLRWKGSPYPSAQSIVNEQWLAHQKALAAYLLQLKRYQKPLLIWQGQGTALYQLYLATSPCSQQLQLYRERKRLGHIVFCRDSIKNLSVTHDDLKNKEAAAFFYPLVHKIARAAKIAEIKWNFKGESLESLTFNKVEVSNPELASLQELLSTANQKELLMNLVPLEAILKSLEKTQLLSS